ncbi:MAG: hypothetical protein JST87_01580 [Bacteroidetes bacterium]|nr:hypothetical protein [Bacteroidota bacterium]
MRDRLTQVRDIPQDIETIIHSFRHYALGDINHNRCKPIAAFILSVCFIDSLSGFIYPLKRDANKRPEDFIDDYMPEYKGLDLYDYVRHSLLHNYSSKGKFDIDNKGNENVPFSIKDGITYINSNVFIDYLEKAFEMTIIKLRDVYSIEHENAKTRSLYHPVLVDAGK